MNKTKYELIQENIMLKLELNRLKIRLREYENKRNGVFEYLKRLFLLFKPLRHRET